MMSKQEPLFLPASFFMIRIPLLSIDLFQEMRDFKGSPRQFAKNFYDRSSCFREAIAIASPSLKASLDKSTFSDDTLYALLKYFTRMVSRSTPYGLFSCISTGYLGQEADISIDFHSLIKRARPDMEWIQQVIDEIGRNSEVLLDLPIQHNPLLHQKGNRFVIEYLREKKDQHSASIRVSPLTEAIFACSKTSIMIRDLISKVTQNLPNIEPEKLKDTISKLLEQQFLDLSLLPSLITTTPFQDFLEKVPHLYKPTLSQIMSKIDHYSLSPPEESEKLFDEVQQSMQDLKKSDFYLQIDSALINSNRTLPKHVAEEIAHSVEVLWKITFHEDLLGLKNYTNKFISKYGFERLIPLFELLDEIQGLGPPSSYTDPEISAIKHSTLYEDTSALLVQCYLNHFSEVEITEEHIQKWAHSIPLASALPSLDVYFEVIAESSQAVMEGNYLAVLTNLTWQGGATFNRFFHLLDPLVQNSLHDFFRNEEALDSNSIFIETSYLPPNARAQNVAIHPNPRDKIINLSMSGKSSINLNELYVGANSNGLFITSHSGEPEYYVTSTNVLNPVFAPIPLRIIRDICKSKYHLCLFWSWRDFNGMPYLPRVRYKKVILSPAAWNVSLEHIGGTSKDTLEALKIKFEKWSTQFHMPRYVFLIQTDQKLLIDLHVSDMLHEILRLLKQNIVLKLIEKIGQEKGEWIESPQGKHCAEFVLPILKNPLYQFSKTHAETPKRSSIAFSPDTRWRLPGSDWLFIKLFLPPSSQNRFINSYLVSFADSLTERQLIDKWFFIRYCDERHHLRVRFHTKDLLVLDPILKLFHDWSFSLIQEGLLQDIAIASYEREIERYGGKELITYAENLFCADSKTVVELMRLEKILNIPSHVLGALSIMNVLHDFQLTRDEIRLFFNLYPTDKNLLKGYREWKKCFEPPCPLEVCLALEHRSKAIEVFSVQMQMLETQKMLIGSRFSIINSLIHMHCNRLLGIDDKVEQKARAHAAHVLLQQTDRKKIHHEVKLN